MDLMPKNVLATLAEAPGRFQRYLDGCTCGRADKAAVTAIKMELEAKDSAIERLEEEIRRKDTEKDNLIHMQKDLQAQIEEIRRVLESHAGEIKSPGEYDKMTHVVEHGAIDQRPAQQFAAQPERSEFETPSVAGNLELAARSAMFMQARVRGNSTRKLMEQKRRDGSIMELPGAKRMVAEGSFPRRTPVAIGRALPSTSPEMPTPLESPPPSGAPAGVSAATSAPPPGEGGYDEESVDSDYDHGDEHFSDLGLELLSGRLTIAKVYGQEEPPANEDELEWESRYCVLYDSKKLCHYDDLEDGLPVGDRGLVDLDKIKAVEKVLGVDTFVMKSHDKVYLLKLAPHDEAMMRTWITAINVELA